MDNVIWYDFGKRTRALVCSDCGQHPATRGAWCGPCREQVLARQRAAHERSRAARDEVEPRLAVGRARRAVQLPVGGGDVA